MTAYRTPLKNVRGLGAAKGGTEPFIVQRVTAAANIVLAAFLVYAALSLVGADRAGVKAFFSQPVAAVLGVLLGISASIHMRIGMQVIIEDYVHDETAKLVLIMANTFFAIAVALAAAYGILKLSFGL